MNLRTNPCMTFLDNWHLPSMCAPLVDVDDLALVVEGSL
jgi:hypothetical protein